MYMWRLRKTNKPRQFQSPEVAEIIPAGLLHIYHSGLAHDNEAAV